MSHNSQGTKERVGQNHMVYGRNCKQLVLLGTEREIEGEVRVGREQGRCTQSADAPLGHALSLALKIL